MKTFSLSFMLTFSLLVGCISFAGISDRLKEAYTESHTAFQDPYASDVEADDLFKNSNTVIGNSGGGESVITRTARFMLRLAVILGIPLLLYVGIKIMLALGDSGKLNTALKEGGMVAAGILLALLSVAIIYLITSLTRSSIGEI